VCSPPICVAPEAIPSFVTVRNSCPLLKPILPVLPAYPESDITGITGVPLGMPVIPIISGNTRNFGIPRKCGRQQFWQKGIALKDVHKKLKLKTQKKKQEAKK